MARSKQGAGNRWWQPAFSLLIVGFPAVARADTLSVCARTCEYTRVEAALAEAETGDTVSVGVGIYPIPTAGLTVKAGVHLVGAGGPFTTLTGDDGNFSTSTPMVGVRLLSGASVEKLSLEGVQRNAIRIEPNARDTQVRGIWVMGQDHRPLNSANIGTDGVGVYVTPGASVEIINSRFENNRGHFGGAVTGVSTDGAITGTPSVVIRQSMFVGNVACQGGAIAMQSGQLTVDGSSFFQNTTLDAGYCDGTTSEGGAIYTSSSGFISTDSRFFQNTSATGGAIHAHSASLTMTGNWFVGNMAETGSGALQWLGSAESATFTAKRSVFAFNEISNDLSANIDGGYGAGALDLSWNTFTTQPATDLTDVAFVYNSGSQGGAIAAVRQKAVVVKDSLICGNYAHNFGGGVYFTESRKFESFGSIFVNNTAESGGGGAYLSPKSVSSSWSLSYSTFLENSGCATYGPVYCGGGVQVKTTDTPSLSSVTDSSFVSQQDGGGLSVEMPVAPTLLRNHFSGNLPGHYSYNNVGQVVFAGAQPMYARWPADCFAGDLRDGSATGAFAGTGHSTQHATDYNDDDHDGYVNLVDCGPANPAVNLSAVETCDGIDNNCDGLVDDVDPLVTDAVDRYFDRDGDGYGGSSARAVHVCAYREGITTATGDCDESDAAVHPNATEIPYNGVDEDCALGDLVDVDRDGEAGLEGGGKDCDDMNSRVSTVTPESCDTIDNNCDGIIDIEPIVNGVIRYLDRDGDMYGDSSTALLVCPDFAGSRVQAGGDCNDNVASIHPGAPDDPLDAVDSDCANGTLPASDLDGDGHVGAADCNEGNPNQYVGNPETCNGLDEDCTGIADDGPIVGVPGTVRYYFDIDGDGHGDPQVFQRFCATKLPGPGFSAAPDDCDETNSTVYTGASELCDDLDNDCDAQIDESPGDDPNASIVYLDKDADGYGTGNPIVVCSVGDKLHASVDGDCNDNDAGISPAAAEIPYDGVDQDCSGADATDLDGDGFVGGFVSEMSDSDCDDSNSTIYPGALEQDLLDGVDQDCDGDPDNDGQTGEGDCDEFDPLRNRDAHELCDGIDNNCDDMVDNDAEDAVWVYPDVDGDLHGDSASEPVYTCVTEGAVLGNDDCDDTEPLAWDDAEELCDGVDNNCDGTVDDGFDRVEVWQDRDGDGYGDETTVSLVCAPADGQVDNSLDCDDTDSQIYPDATEVFGDGIDQDCDGADDQSWQFGGGGCNQSGAAPHALLATLVLAVYRRRR